jgi:hypothetical protein
MVAAVVLDRCGGWRRVLRLPSNGQAPIGFDDRVIVIFDDRVIVIFDDRAITVFDDRAITVFDSCPYPSGTMGRA